jgi:hypothetical protein
MLRHIKGMREADAQTSLDHPALPVARPMARFVLDRARTASEYYRQKWTSQPQPRRRRRKKTIDPLFISALRVCQAVAALVTFALGATALACLFAGLALSSEFDRRVFDWWRR